MTGENLYLFIKIYFDYKVEMQSLNSRTHEVWCDLYNSFLFICKCDELSKTFEGAILFGSDEIRITEFLGKRCQSADDPESIGKSLNMIDEYCRLRLPDKFLYAYENINKQVK